MEELQELQQRASANNHRDVYEQRRDDPNCDLDLLKKAMSVQLQPGQHQAREHKPGDQHNRDAEKKGYWRRTD